MGDTGTYLHIHMYLNQPMHTSMYLNQYSSELGLGMRLTGIRSGNETDWNWVWE